MFVLFTKRSIFQVSVLLKETRPLVLNLIYNFALFLDLKLLKVKNLKMKMNMDMTIHTQEKVNIMMIMSMNLQMILP